MVSAATNGPRRANRGDFVEQRWGYYRRSFFDLTRVFDCAISDCSDLSIR
jgi:hypothetical protein